MVNNKRKRDDDGDSDEDPSYGMRQILPVASLPANFDGEPVDGMQYLFMVRYVVWVLVYVLLLMYAQTQCKAVARRDASTEPI